MHTVSITNLTTSPLVIQDPSGNSGLTFTVPSSGSATRTVTTEQLDSISPLLDALQTRSILTWSLTDVLNTKTKFLLAGFNRVHMATNAQGLATVTNLGVLAPGATQAQANAYAETLRNSLVHHMLGVGSFTHEGTHLVADTPNHDVLVAIPALGSASLLADCITLVEGLNTAITRHAVQPYVHFHDRVSAQGTRFPLGHVYVQVTATQDGEGGTVYTSQVMSTSGGFRVLSIAPDSGFIRIEIELPIEIPPEVRVTSTSIKIIPPLSDLSPFIPITLEIENSGTDASVGLPLDGKTSDVPRVTTVGATYILALSSVPIAPVSILPPVTLADVITDLNECRTSLITHYSAASE